MPLFFIPAITGAIILGFIYRNDSLKSAAIALLYLTCLLMPFLYHWGYFPLMPRKYWFGPLAVLILNVVVYARTLQAEYRHLLEFLPNIKSNQRLWYAFTLGSKRFWAFS